MIEEKDSALVTLIMSVVKPGEGAWYSVDNRVTEGNTIKDYDARKQIYCVAGMEPERCCTWESLSPTSPRD